jgi:outer membrane protein TolC
MMEPGLPCFAASGRARAALAILLLLAGCATPAPERSPPLEIEVPAAWVEASAARAAESAWWRAFDDPSLPPMVEQAIRANRDLKAAAARIAAAEAEARVAGADLYPQLSAGASAARGRQVETGLSNQTSFGASLDLSWEIDLWGRIRSGTQGALADLEAQRADYAAAALSLAAPRWRSSSGRRRVR